jgi:drug/metabolite transporter (DMT)-like permease
MREEVTGGVFVALASLQFGGLVVLGKIVTRHGLPVFSMLAIRFAIGAIILAAVLSIIRRPLRPASGEGVRIILLGAFGYGVEATLFFLAIARGTASAVTLLFFVYPVIVTLASVVLGIGIPNRLLVSSLVLAVAGSTLVISSSGSLDISGPGIAFAIGSAAAFAVYLLAMERTLKRTSSICASMWVSAAAAASIGVFAIAKNEASLPSRTSDWFAVVGMGLFSAGAFLCLFLGLRRIGVIRTAVVAALEPLSTAALAVIFLGEPIRGGTLAGGAFVLAGAVGASLARARAAADEPSVP